MALVQDYKCDDCKTYLVEGAEVYCGDCYANLNDQLTNAEDEIEELQNEVQRLKNELREMEDETIRRKPVD